MERKTVFGFGALALGMVAVVGGLWFAGRSVDEIFNEEDWLGFVWG